MQNLTPIKARKGRTTFHVALAALMIFAVPAVVPQAVNAQVQVMDVSALAERLLPAVVNISSLRVSTSSQSRGATCQRPI